MTLRRLLVILSCLLFPALLSAQSMTELPVARVEFCPNSRTDCPRWQPFVRVGDMSGPIWFLLSTSGMGCEVDGMVAGKIRRPGEWWACVWRVARP